MSDTPMPAGEPERKPARYPQVLRLCIESPWAIRAEKLVAIKEMLTLRASGERFSAEDIEARIGSGLAHQQRSTSGTVAVLPLYGVITPKADLFTEMSGGTSVQGFSDSFRAALADPGIDSILIDIDSPGGMTDLVPELAAEVREARGVKPITAIANTDAASAAYWIGAQADEFVVTPSGMVGSIGVFAAHDDVSAAMEQDGVKTTLISAGKYKVEANPYEALSGEARAAIQARVDSFYAAFVADVALGRGVSAGAVQSGFGEGRIVTASEALASGMVDRVDTFEATVERMIVDAAGGAPVRHAAYAASETLEINLEAAKSGLLFVQSAASVRDAARKLTADAGALRVLTAAKRDVLSQVSDALSGSSRALAELVAESAADPGADALAQGVLALARRKHTFLATGVVE